jgi:hypothetical protein
MVQPQKLSCNSIINFIVGQGIKGVHAQQLILEKMNKKLKCNVNSPQEFTEEQLKNVFTKIQDCDKKKEIVKSHFRNIIDEDIRDKDGNIVKANNKEEEEEDKKTIEGVENLDCEVLKNVNEKNIGKLAEEVFDAIDVNRNIEGGKRRTRKRGKKARRSKKNNKKRKGKKSKRTRKHK